MTQHTVKAYGDELDQLTAEVARMGGLAEAQVADAIESVARRDVRLAEQVAARDASLDAMEAEIEKRAIRVIALRQPMANDLRHAVAAMKIASNLERCGDLAKNIGKRVGRMNAAAAEIQSTPIAGLGRMAADRLAAVVGAYRDGDAQAAYSVWLKDTELDERHDGVLREIVAGMVAEPATVEDSTHLLFIAKNLERIGDHATNIAELIHYQITGAELTERPKL